MGRADLEPVPARAGRYFLRAAFLPPDFLAVAFLAVFLAFLAGARLALTRRTRIWSDRGRRCQRCLGAFSSGIDVDGNRENADKSGPGTPTIIFLAYHLQRDWTMKTKVFELIAVAVLAFC